MSLPSRPQLQPSDSTYEELRTSRAIFGAMRPTVRAPFGLQRGGDGPSKGKSGKSSGQHFRRYGRLFGPLTDVAAQLAASLKDVRAAAAISEAPLPAKPAKENATTKGTYKSYTFTYFKYLPNHDSAIIKMFSNSAEDDDLTDVLVDP